MSRMVLPSQREGPRQSSNLFFKKLWNHLSIRVLLNQTRLRRMTMASTLQKLNNNPDAADLSEQVETLRNDLATLTQTVADLGKAKGDDAVAAAQFKLLDARDKAADVTETARLQAMELQNKADTFIKNQPDTALGIAAGGGFLVEFFGSRK
ncbi:YqjD family protein [Roseobacter fucihabitans]|nr:hypothetical protein [Roseobacter litoralis]